jgi:hypothetical protein
MSLTIMGSQGLISPSCTLYSIVEVLVHPFQRGGGAFLDQVLGNYLHENITGCWRGHGGCHTGGSAWGPGGTQVLFVT